jgi:membrane protein
MRHTIMNIASLSVDTPVGVVTALTGLIAAAVATTQLSYRYRMMRTATWAQEQIPSATGERKQHLENMQRWAQSEVVAATMIPAWKYVEAIVVATVTVMIPVLREQPMVPFMLIMFGVQILEYRRVILFYLERQKCARNYYLGQPVRPARIGFLLPLNKQTYKTLIPAGLTAFAVTITSFALAKFVHHSGSSAFMCAIIIGVVALNCIGDVHRSTTHPFLEHLKKY